MNVRSLLPALALAWLSLASLAACGSNDAPTPESQQGSDASTDGAVDTAAQDASDASDGGCGPGFITQIVSVSYGQGAGFGQTQMPGVVFGPPKGGGKGNGGLDVVSLGIGGEIVLAFAGSGIADEAGPDFIVFENAFQVGGGPSTFAELGEVSVSDDGATWNTFPCSRDGGPPNPGCAGWSPVLSNPNNGISPFDPQAAGGEAFDLATVSASRARYVRIKDLTSANTGNSSGFDLDAISVIHPRCP